MKRLQIFNLHTGEHLSSHTLPFRPHEIYIKDNNHYFFKLSEYNDESDQMYQTHHIVLTDSLFTPINFFVPHSHFESTKTLYLSINNPLIWDNESLYFFYPLMDYLYRYTEEDFVPHIALDFGEKYEIPSQKRYDDEAFTKYSKSNDYAYFIESPILMEKYIAGIIRVNNTKRFFLYNYQQSFTQEINLNKYNVFDPIFPIGKDTNNTLISTLDVIGINQLKSKNKYIEEITGNEECNFLLFTKLK